jgi:hypothetical protein
MPNCETLTDRIAVSIFCLRNARAGLALVPPQHDRLTVKARIDICDEMINRVGEIDRNLRQLSSDAHRARSDGTYSRDGVYRSDGSSSGTNS